MTDALGHRSIATGFSVGDAPKTSPDLLVESGPVQEVESRLETDGLSGKVGPQPGHKIRKAIIPANDGATIPALKFPAKRRFVGDIQ
jgi:hypothetical protein